MIIFGYDTATINWYLVLYVVLSIVFLGFGTNAVFSTGQIRGVIFGIGSALVLVYFGLKWFANPVAGTTEWPPAINMCPDYLTFFPNLRINLAGTPATPPAGTAATAGVVTPTTRGGCVDMLGVSLNRVLKKTTSSALEGLSTAVNMVSSSPNTYKIFQYSYDDFKAAITKGGTEGSKDVENICNACRTAGITWEGVYDGDTCIGLNRFNLIAKKVEQCVT